jgi:hypothetical protein
MNEIIYDNKTFIIYQSNKYNKGKAKPPFHNDKKMIQVILEILNNSDVFIETGSFMGKTIFFVGKNFPQLNCYSCEINKNSYNIANEQVKNLSNVKLDLSPSPTALYNIQLNYDKGIFSKKVCFWLDAHLKTNPLYDEIKYITTNFKEFCIFIDDFTIPWDNGFWTDGYNIDKIKPYIMNKEKLKFYMPNYPSTDICCKENACGYIIITNININTFNYLKEINIDMVKVFFCCSWDSDSLHFFKEKYKPLTPNSKGIWKNIIAVTDISKADWVVIIDDIHNKQKKQILNFNKDRVICIPREPSRTKPSYLNYNFKYKYTYNNFYHCWSSIMCIKKTYDELLAYNKKPLKNKLCSTITSRLNLGNGLYAARIDFIKKLSKQKQFLNKIDIYGYNWTGAELGEMFKGTFGGFNSGTSHTIDKLLPNTTKWNGLENYSYSIAIENASMKNYFSEKFTDCILSWTIPIYYGCPNINEYFPPDCYYWLDITSSNCFEELDKILNTPITDKQINAIEKARDIILNKHNVWEVVNNIIKND